MASAIDCGGCRRVKGCTDQCEQYLLCKIMIEHYQRRVSYYQNNLSHWETKQSKIQRRLEAKKNGSPG